MATCAGRVPACRWPRSSLSGAASPPARLPVLRRTTLKETAASSIDYRMHTEKAAPHTGAAPSAASQRFATVNQPPTANPGRQPLPIVVSRDLIPQGRAAATDDRANRRTLLAAQQRPESGAAGGRRPNDHRALLHRARVANDALRCALIDHAAWRDGRGSGILLHRHDARVVERHEWLLRRHRIAH